MADTTGLRLVASGGVRMHVRSRKALHDVMTAIRTGRPLTECGRELQVNAERHLRTRLRLSQTFPADLLAEYASLRGGAGGIGVSRLVGSQCGGCHLTLSAMEVARLRKLPDGEIAHCDECGRILVP